MRRAVVSGIVVLPLVVLAGCFSNDSSEGSIGGGINVNPDSSFVQPADASDATNADSAVDSAPDTALQDSAVDAPSDVADACEGACAGLYATCAEVHAAMPAAADGSYTLHVGHDGAKDWTAYCAGLATTPREYLTFAQTGAGSNFSQYTASSETGGTNVVTSFTKVRIDPTTLIVDTSDETFSSSTGSLMNPPSGPTVTSMSYASAMDCAGTGSLTGIGDVDLRGTPFSVAPAWFSFPPGGVSSVGTATYSAQNQVVELTGGGNCGWEAPLGFTDAPYNVDGGPMLNLIYGLGVDDAGASNDAGDAGDAAD
jgi:predicted lipoprotein with Yx(FWY)xxD motif